MVTSVTSIFCTNSVTVYKAGSALTHASAHGGTSDTLWWCVNVIVALHVLLGFYVYIYIVCVCVQCMFSFTRFLCLHPPLVGWSLV